jgi:hypothetical protein
MYRNPEARRDNFNGTIRAKPWAVFAEIDRTHETEGTWQAWEEVILCRFATYEQAAEFVRDVCKQEK